jgi:hypothetical protein
MPEISIVKLQPIESQREDMMDAMRGMLFGGVVDGLGEVNKSRWRRFWAFIVRAEVGEVFDIVTHTARLGWYHRKHMKLETRLFDEQERFKDFEQFRNWLKIGAGHVDWFPGPRGGIVAIPRSISYPKMEQGEFEEFHAAAVAFVRTPKAQRTLWPKAPAAHAAGFVEQVLGEFRE